MNLNEWFYEYFIKTGYGYNPFNTTAYSIILIIFVFLIFKILNKLKIKIDRNLALAVSPFVFFGSSLRVLEDADILYGRLFITPGIYFLVFGITLLTLLLSVFIERKKSIPYFKPMFIVGIILSSLVLGNLQYKNFMGFGYIILFFIPWVILLKLIPWLTENKIVTSLHLFDGTATFVSLNFFDYFEQHILPRYLINFFGTPFSFVIFKFLVVTSVLILMDKYSKDKKFNNYLKLIIGILGAATGLRDFLRLLCLT